MQRTQRLWHLAVAATVATEWASVSAFPGCAAGWELQMGQQHMYGCTCVPHIHIHIHTVTHKSMGHLLKIRLEPHKNNISN